MKSNLLKSFIALILVLILPLSVLAAGIMMPSYYGESYYAQLPELYHRLYGTQGKKLVLIGGSNIAFGVDTQLLQDTLKEQGYDYTVCPFGLYAAVGSSAMLSLAEDALGAGDIVILAIEPTPETLSTYFGATAFWKCCEDAPELILKLSSQQCSTLAGNYIPYLQERFSIWMDGTAPRGEGVYAKASFDETCNMIYDRAGNAMVLGYDTAAPVDFSTLTVQAEFAQQVNEFITLAESKGANVYLSFSPVNRSALTNADTQPLFDLFAETFHCPIISDPENYVLDSGWFFDSNFHLNSSGARVRTARLAGDILAQLGCYAPVEIESPQMPASIAQVVASEGDEACFQYESIGSGWRISGLTESGRNQAALTVPATYLGGPVVGLTADALAKASNLEELTLPGSIESIPDGLLAQCPSLQRLILQHTQSIPTITARVFDGADQVKVLVPAQALALYRDGDGCEANPWSEHLDRIYSIG